jgi:hypothetical protein
MLLAYYDLPTFIKYPINKHISNELIVVNMEEELYYYAL